jgi:hypothetical protein
MESRDPYPLTQQCKDCGKRKTFRSPISIYHARWNLGLGDWGLCRHCVRKLEARPGGWATSGPWPLDPPRRATIEGSRALASIKARQEAARTNAGSPET